MEVTHRFIGKERTGLHTGPALPREIAEQENDSNERPLYGYPFTFCRCLGAGRNQGNGRSEWSPALRTKYATSIGSCAALGAICYSRFLGAVFHPADIIRAS